MDTCSSDSCKCHWIWPWSLLNGGPFRILPTRYTSQVWQNPQQKRGAETLDLIIPPSKSEIFGFNMFQPTYDGYITYISPVKQLLWTVIPPATACPFWDPIGICSPAPCVHWEYQPSKTGMKH